jgi:hypothetical protein
MRRRSRWHYSVMWLWLATAVSWALVVGCGFAITALVAYLR